MISANLTFDWDHLKIRINMIKIAISKRKNRISIILERLLFDVILNIKLVSEY